MHINRVGAFNFYSDTFKVELTYIKNPQKEFLSEGFYLSCSWFNFLFPTGTSHVPALLLFRCSRPRPGLRELLRSYRFQPS
jgi:hypothetical protein